MRSTRMAGAARYAADARDQLAAMNAEDERRIAESRRRIMDGKGMDAAAEDELNAMRLKRIAERKRILDSIR